MKRRIPFAILSGARTAHDAEINRARTAEVFDHLQARGLAVKLAQGAYQGTQEPAVIVLLPDGTNGAGWMYVRQVAIRYGQETVLFVGADGSATLYEPRGDWQQYLGQWREVSREAAQAADAYTFDPVTCAYYVAH